MCLLSADQYLLGVCTFAVFDFFMFLSLQLVFCRNLACKDDRRNTVGINTVFIPDLSVLFGTS